MYMHTDQQMEMNNLFNLLLINTLFKIIDTLF